MPPKVDKPLGATIVELLRMPIEIAEENIPELQQQVKALPGIIRENISFGVKSFRQIPDNLQSTIRSGARTESQNLPLLLTKAASPFPLLSPQELQEQAQKMSQQASENATKQIDVSKVIEDRTKLFSEQLAKKNQAQ